MKYVIDRIENNIAILENIDSKEIKEIPKSLLPDNVKEGTILKEIYIIDKEQELTRRKNIQIRFDNLIEEDNNEI